jgi:hypothetical protein
MAEDDEKYATLKVRVPVQPLLDGTQEETEAKITQIGKRGGKSTAQRQAEWRERQTQKIKQIGTVIRQFHIGKYRITLSKVE